MTTRDVNPGSALRGSISVPGDKSISHRALLLNAAGKGSGRITGLAPGDDVMASVDAIRALGVNVVRQDDAWLIESDGVLTEPTSALDCRNSGTTMRFLCGLIAPSDVYAVLIGDSSLQSRPMKRITQPLYGLGCRVDGRESGAYAPLAIRGGAIRAGRHDLNIASAQLKSALLLAGREVGAAVREPRQSRDHTERMLRKMGASLYKDSEGWLTLSPRADLQVVDVDVPGDLSAAAFLLVAASLVPGSELELPRVGVNPTRTGVLDVLRSMGADIDVERIAGKGEPVADIRVRSATLKGVTIKGELTLRCLDELPVIAVAAACAEGQTIIEDAAELRVKESDRIARVVAGLRELGVDIVEKPDGMVINGGGLKGQAEISGHGDHRIAMAFAVAGMVAPGGVQLQDADSVTSSYPAFFDDVERIRA